MRGMRQAKNPNAKSKFVERAIERFRREDDDEDYSDYDDEDFEALEECDGTETGALAEFCTEENVARVSRPTMSHHESTFCMSHNMIYNIIS